MLSRSIAPAPGEMKLIAPKRWPQRLQDSFAAVRHDDSPGGGQPEDTSLPELPKESYRTPADSADPHSLTAWGQSDSSKIQGGLLSRFNSNGVDAAHDSIWMEALENIFGNAAGLAQLPWHL